MKKHTKPRGLTVADHERHIAEKIIELMERDGIQWIKPWASMRPFCNASSGHIYTGGNVFTLMLESMIREVSDPRFMTFKQARDLGGCVKKGSTGIPIVFFGTARNNEDTGDHGETRWRRFAKISRVFALKDIEGLDEDKLVPLKTEAVVNPDQRDSAASDFFKATGSTVRHGGDRALYAPLLDYIQMPKFEDFRSAEAYYATLAHEHVHWTGHATRLARPLLKNDGDHDYAFEELVAEIGSVFVCNRLGIMPEPREENAAYVKGWMKSVKDKPHAFWQAASLAQKAADFLSEPHPQLVEDAA